LEKLEQQNNQLKSRVNHLEQVNKVFKFKIDNGLNTFRDTKDRLSLLSISETKNMRNKEKLISGKDKNKIQNNSNQDKAERDHRN